MFLFSVAILLVMAALAVKFLGRKYSEQKGVLDAGSLLGLGLGGVLILASITAEVPEGNQGILKTFGAAADKTLAPGLHFVLPWQSVELLSTRAEAYSAEFDAQSQDLQKIGIKATVIYNRKPSEAAAIYKRVRQDSSNTDLKPGTKEVLKAAAAKFDAKNLIQHRSQLSAMVQTNLSAWIGQYGLDMGHASIVNVDFHPDYDKKVEEKVTAVESAKKAKHELEEQKIRALIRATVQTGVAEEIKEKARGTSESQRLLATAGAYKQETLALADAAKMKLTGDAEAYRAQLIANALAGNPELLKFEAIQAWTGEVPKLAQNEFGLPFSSNAEKSGTPKPLGIDSAELDRKVIEFLNRFQK